MASPVNPTLVSIVAEGLYQAGEFTPSSATTARYQNEVMEQLKNEIWKACRQPKVMQTFSYGVLVPGQSRYSCPSDYSSDMSMALLWGSLTGTAQGGSTTSIILASGSNLGLNDILGKEILITGGTGVACVSQAVSISGDTVQVVPGFAVAPDSTSTYMFIDEQSPVTFDHVAEQYRLYRAAVTGRPRKAFPIGDEDFDEFIFDVIPDKAYGAKFFYYANLMKTDLSSQLMSRLYLEWRNFWIQGIKASHLRTNDDVRGNDEWAAWMNEVQKLVVTATYGVDLHEFAQVVTDY